MRIDWDQVAIDAKKLILDGAEDALPGPAKMDRLVRRLKGQIREQLDAAIRLRGIAEALSDAAIALALEVAEGAIRHTAQRVYDDIGRHP